MINLNFCDIIWNLFVYLTSVMKHTKNWVTIFLKCCYVSLIHSKQELWFELECLFNNYQIFSNLRKNMIEKYIELFKLNGNRARY